MTTEKKPKPNETIPFKFCCFVKNGRVDFGPIFILTPEIKRVWQKNLPKKVISE
uniref:Uncharacterized protein n=1 Tax=Rhizophora mucronata TaxID=61149 RepID=A0A2P2MVV9_RHIMU